MALHSRATILVKAYPQPSKTHSETVCCAGLDPDGNWKRLYPVRFRQLAGEQVFNRWNIVEFRYRKPTSDARPESCRVFEDTISVERKVTSKQEKSDLVSSALRYSERDAAARRESLTLIRPTKPRLKWRRRSDSEIEQARSAFELQARQASMFDKNLDVLEPCPFEFTMHYDDGDGPHKKTCADWETSAAFFKLSKHYEEAEVLNHLERTYCEEYVKTGLVFALGNIAARPQTWQLLGIFPCEDTGQQLLRL